MEPEIINKLNIWKISSYARWWRIDLKIGMFFRKIKWSYQRAIRGYCDYDLYNFDYTLGNYIAGALSTFRKKTHGYPIGMTEEKWDIILSQISYDFYLATNEEEWFNPYEEEYYKALEEYGLEANKNKPEVADKFYKREDRNLTMRTVRKQDGFKLLEEHFFDLWD